MLVFFAVLVLAFAAEGLCQDALTIAQPTRPRLCPENEIYVKCRTICPPQFCNISSSDYKCVGVLGCEPGCDCIKDYLRDYNGNCVLNDKCPAQCGENQVPSDCADDYSDVPTIQVCQPGCRCVEGYIRNSYNQCVPIPPLLPCGKNEEPTVCMQTCPPQSCFWNPFEYACKPGPCQPGCNCKKGYLKDEKENCIPQENCPPILPQCGENEEPTDCAKNIRPGDSTLTIKCRLCQCIENYVRDSNGLCVSSETPYIYDRCTPTCSIPNPPNCPQISDTATNRCNCAEEDDLCKNEQNTTYTLCPYRCKSTCKNPNGICSQECRVSYGCACRPGYLLSEKGTCILPEDCPGGNPCKENQIFVYCNAGCPTANCPENDNQAVFACDQPDPCPSGCACKRNYRRRSVEDDTCILASECPPVKCTRPNEIWNPCPEPCFSEGCGDRQTKICWTLIAPECQPQCVCEKNHRRNASGICVPISQCPPQCGINEEPTNCGDTLYPQPLATDEVSVSRIRCLPGCKCIAGYVRDRSGKCVKSQPVCGKFEEPNICIAIYPSNCPKCRCIANYVRNSKGKCVPITTILQCGKNEEPNECSIIYSRANQPLEPSTDVAAVEPVEAQRIRCRPCKCIVGYVRDANGVCVQSPPVCGKFEEPNFCIAIYPSNCPKCRCIANYVRNSKGKCVPSSSCGQNETYVPCIVPCPTNYCPKDDNLILVQCLVPSPCPGGCACKSNYTRISSEDQRCILASDCPPIKCTGKNTVYNSCPSACFSDVCGTLQMEPKVCNTLVPNVCRPRCVCREKHRRDSAGNCIPIEQCPPQCGKNEEPNYCPILYAQSAPEVPVETAVIDQVAVKSVETEKIRCRPCKCIDGYVRDINGECIPKFQCGKNEEPNYCPIFYPQSVEVPVETSVIDQASVKSVETEKIRCRPCKCIDGYVRDINGECVAKTECGENEVSTDCKQECPPQDCAWDRTRMDCRPVECKPGCNCIEGYLRDVYGNCIPREKCPECNGDPNAVYAQCPNQCISSCKNPNAVCSQECGEPFGCKCRLGYILSDEGRCILPAECPGGNPCGRNETYAACLIGCPTNNCPKDDSLAIPQCLPPFPCPGGCACQSNYRRISSEDKRCILASDCPPIKCTRKNEVYKPCPSACFSEVCGTLQMEPKVCNTLVPNVCRPRCVCREKYRRDSAGNCIPIKQCPPVKCPRNEFMNPCPSACFGDACGELDEETAACNTLVAVECRPRCMCQKGYQRDTSGKCIPKAECPAVL